MRIEADASHQAAVALIRWSAYGKRLITADRTGSVIGWRIDPQKQLAVIFHHELKDELRGLVFCSSPEEPSPNGGSEQQLNGDLDISGLARAAVAGDETALDLFTSWNTNNNRRHSFSLLFILVSDVQCLKSTENVSRIFIPKKFVKLKDDLLS